MARKHLVLTLPKLTDAFGAKIPIVLLDKYARFIKKVYQENIENIVSMGITKLRFGDSSYTTIPPGEYREYST